MVSNSDSEPDRQSILDDLKPKRMSVFLLFRYAGMLLLFSSMIFLFQKHKAPIITWNELSLYNGQVGNLLFSAGTGLFFIYLIHRVYAVIKRN